MELNELAAQERYARWLAWSTRIGLGFLVLAFLWYLADEAPHVPIDQLPELWKRSAFELLHHTGRRAGWHWASLVHHSDMLVLAAIAFLASCSIVCLAVVVPIFRRRGETVFAITCVLQIAVLVLAASGVLSGGH